MLCLKPVHEQLVGDEMRWLLEAALSEAKAAVLAVRFLCSDQPEAFGKMLAYNDGETLKSALAETHDRIELALACLRRAEGGA